MTSPTRPSELPGEHLPMFVMDVLQHDAMEQLPSILRLLNNPGCVGWRAFWGRDFTREEVVAALGELVGQEWVEARRESDQNDELAAVESGNLDIGRDQARLWFGLTDQGRRAWHAWQPPVEPAAFSSGS